MGNVAESTQIVVIIYMLLMVGVGLYFYRYQKGAEDFFKGGSRIPWWAAGISTYMSGFSAYSFVGIAYLVASYGAAGMAVEFGPAIAYLIALLVFARRFNKARVLTPIEYLEKRFGPLTRQIVAWGNILRVLFEGGRLYAVAILISVLTGFGRTEAIIGCGVVVLLYSVLGGLWAVIVTDVIQFIVLFLTVIPIFIMSIVKVGGLGELIFNAPIGTWSIPALSSVDKGWLWIAAWWTVYMVNYNSHPGLIQRVASTANPKEARKSAALTFGLALPHSLLLFLPVLIYRSWGWFGKTMDAETVYGFIATDILPPTMIGIVIAAMLAAAMSALDTEYNIQAAIFVNDVYNQKIRKKASNWELLLVGRLAVIFLTVENVGIALMIHMVDSLNAYEFSKIIAVMLALTSGIPLLVGIVYKKATQRGAILAMILGFIWAFLHSQDFHNLGMGYLAPWPMSYQIQALTTAIVCISTMILSGFFPRKKKDKVLAKKFFEKLEEKIEYEKENLGIENVPIPFTIIGVFTVLIGILMLSMLFVEKSAYNRIFTGTIASILIILGIVLRYAGYIARKRRNELIENRDKNSIK